MTAQRRAFALWFGLGGGALVALTHELARAWAFPESSAGAVVDATPVDPGLSVPVRIAVLLVGAGVIGWASAYVALASIGRTAPERKQFALLIGLLAPLVALANIYLAYHSGPDWLYESVTTGEGGVVIHRRERNPFFVHLLLTLPIAGIIAGAVTSTILRTANTTRTLAMIAAFAVAGIVAAYVAIPVVYLLGGALTELSEGLGIGPRPGSIVGSFLAGYVIGYVFGIVAGFALPGEVKSQKSEGRSVPSGSSDF